MKRPPPRLLELAPVLCAVLGVALARIVGRVALEDVPHVMDETVYWLQARTFAMGHLTEAVRLPRASFAMWFVDDRTRFYGIFPPGWPAVLSVGHLVGLAHWVNPLLHGATTLVVARSARLLSRTPARAAALAAALYAFSPQALLLAGSLMSHALVALAAAATLLIGVVVSGLARARDDDGDASDDAARPVRPWLLALGSAFVTLAALTRPLCGVALALVLGLFVVVGWRRRRIAISHVALAIVPVAVGMALLGAYNAALTGSALRFPQTEYFDGHLPPVDLSLFHYHPGCNALGFGADRGCEDGLPHGHTIGNAFSNLGDNLTAWFWLAGGGPLAFLLAGVGMAAARRADRRARLAAFAFVPTVLVLYGLYWYAGTAYGARFYHAALPALLVLAAVGLDAFDGVTLLGSATRRRVAAHVVLALFLAWNVAFGVKASLEVSHGYWGNDARFVHFAETWKGPRALVLVAFADADLHGHHELTTFMRDVPWLDNIRALGALSANQPDLSGPLVFARYHPGLMPELRAAFPGRELQLYVVSTHGPDRVVRYEDTKLPALEAGAPRPKDNFDAFILPP